MLVGGFAASDWLFNQVHDALTPIGLNIVRPENHVWVFFKVETILIIFNIIIQKQSCVGWCDLILPGKYDVASQYTASYKSDKQESIYCYY